MQIKLTVTAGPHEGNEFVFEGRDTFLVGRSQDAHFQLSKDDPFLSRRHFLIEINPPRCRITDMKSRCGTFVNGKKIDSAELIGGDLIRAGRTVLRIAVTGLPQPEQASTVTLLGVPEAASPSHSTKEGTPGIGVPTLPGLAIEAEIGRGSMGVVYRARRLSDDLMVAVKTIHPIRGAGAKERALFVREAKILRELHHSHIVRYLDACECENQLYLITEFVRGLDAAKLLEKRGPFDLPQAVRIACQLLRALDYAHARGIVHRDIKPSNILLEKREKKPSVVKLADFGLARAYEASGLSGLSMQGEVCGTFGFMPPEQVTHYRQVKPSGDQYSAAATLYQLLTGKFVHDLPKKYADVMAHIVTQDFVPIDKRRDDLPAGFVAVLHRALSREPENRFESAKEFMEKLQPFAVK